MGVDSERTRPRPQLHRIRGHAGIGLPEKSTVAEQDVERPRATGRCRTQYVFERKQWTRNVAIRKIEDFEAVTIFCFAPCHDQPGGRWFGRYEIFILTELIFRSHLSAGYVADDENLRPSAVES